MNILKYLFVLLLLFPAYSHGSSNPYILGGAVPVSACATSQDSETETSTGHYGVGEFAVSLWTATKFTAGATYTVCKAELYLEPQGSPTQTLTVCIYTDSSDEPGTQVGTCSDTVAASGLSAGENAVAFINMSASLTSSTSYWLVIHTGVGENDSSNYADWHYEASGAVEHIMYDADGVGPWSEGSSTVTYKYILYSN